MCKKTAKTNKKSVKSGPEEGKEALKSLLDQESLLRNVFGNYVIQKMIEHGSHQQI